MKGFYYNKNKVYFNNKEVPQYSYSTPILHYGEIPTEIKHTYNGISAIHDFIEETSGALGIWYYKTEIREKIIYRMNGIDFSKRIKPQITDSVSWIEYPLIVNDVSVRDLQRLDVKEFAEWCRDNAITCPLQYINK